MSSRLGNVEAEFFSTETETQTSLASAVGAHRLKDLAHSRLVGMAEPEDPEWPARHAKNTPLWDSLYHVNYILVWTQSLFAGISKMLDH